jgi:formylglycine-generating enzyme required for sulfatase activity
MPYQAFDFNLLRTRLGNMIYIKVVAAALLACLIASSTTSKVRSDTFGSGSNTFTLDFVYIGSPGNAADTTGEPKPAGEVGYSYWIGKYEISRETLLKASAAGNLGLTLNPMSLLTNGPRPAMPATGLTWNEAARFVNWLNTSQGFAPAYKFSSAPDGTNSTANENIAPWSFSDAGFNPANPIRNRLAHYVLPSVDEWYKAAYYNPVNGTYYDFATGSDSIPLIANSGTLDGSSIYKQRDEVGPADVTLAGGLSPYGTMGQGGNVWEWEESPFDLGIGANDIGSAARAIRGGSWSLNSDGIRSTRRSDVSPDLESPFFGIRVVKIPEPGTFPAAVLALAYLHTRRRRPSVPCSKPCLVVASV